MFDRRFFPDISRQLALVLFVAMLAACTKSPEEQLADARAALEARDPATAAVMLRNLLQDDPENMAGRLALAEASIALGDPISAEKELVRARDLGADAREHMRLHFRILLALGRYAEMLELLGETGVPEGLEPVEALNFRGRALLGLGSALEAERTFVEAAGLAPDSPDAAWGIVASHVALGRLDEAGEEIANVVARYPEYPEGWLLKAQLAMRGGRPAVAANDFSEAVDAARAVPDRLIEIPALAGLADAYMTDRRLEEAERAVNQLISASGPAPVTRFLVARLAAANGDYDMAANELEAVLNVAPNNIQALLLYGSVNLAQENYAQAEATLSQVVARQPANLVARRLLAAAQVELAAPAAAVETLTPLLDSASDDPQLSVFASQAMLQSGSVDEAVALLEKAVADDPDNADLLLSLAATYLSAQRTQDAIRLIESIPEGDRDFRRGLLLAIAYSADDRSEEAEQQIETIMERYANDVQAQTLAGDFFLRRSQFDKARPYLEQAVELDSTSVPARLSLGRLLERTDDLAAAGEQYRAVLALDDSNIVAMTSLANLAVRNGDLRAAEDMLEEAIATNESAPLPRVMLARTYQLRGDFERAEQTVREAARIGARDALTQLAAGDLLVGNGKYREALPFLVRATELSPGVSRIWFSLARAQLALGDNVDARTSLNRARTLDPDSMDAMTAMALVELSDGNTVAALGIAEELQAIYPDQVAPLSLEADILMSEERFDEAAEAYRRGFEIAPTSLLARRAFQAAMQAEREKPQEILERWTEKNPDDVVVQMLLGQYYDEAGEDAKAVSHYESALRLDANHVAALNNLAWLYNELDDARAEGLARRAYELRPDVASVADTLGWILVSDGDVGGGLALIEEAASKSPGSATIQYHIAYARNELGDRESSRQILNSIVASGVEFPEREAAEQLLKELGE